ncbi:MAG: hypothetical protein ACT4PL_10645 [Phycisphaerales bacterium]
MNASPLELLRKLASGVVPDGARLAGGAVSAAGQGVATTFAALLKAAGGAESGLPVSSDEKLGLVFTQEQSLRLSAAADKAEQQGFATAIVCIDGLHLTLDVMARRITGIVDPSGPALSGVDGYVLATPAAVPDEPPAGKATPPGASGPATPTVARTVPTSALYSHLASLSYRPQGSLPTAT